MKKVFYIGVTGAVLSGMFLDGRGWWIALIAVVVFAGLAVIGYRTMDISEVLDDLEPLKVKQKKEANRQRTFTEWLAGASVTMKMP